MKLLEWRDNFAIGIAEIDHEHRDLIAHINRIHQALGRAPTGAEVSDFFGDMHADIAAHFALEEKNMQAIGYDQFASHKADHERLLDELHEMSNEALASARLDDAQLAERLNSWFTVHFQTHDARLHRFLAGPGSHSS